MGRSNNSFTSYVGHALEINTDKIKTPEQDLWTSVLSKAAHDAIYSSDWVASKRAIAWFQSNSKDFREVCQFAGRNPAYVYSRMVKPIMTREAHMESIRTGTRLYVKDNQGLPRGGKVYHTHYRGSRLHYKPHSPRGVYKKKKRGRPPKKDPYYVLMGKKGGRPRMYNGI